MFQKIKSLILRYRDQLLYLIFGGMTTVIDWVACFVLYRAWSTAIEQNELIVHVANVIAWVLAVLFAFVTNRLWVFHSERRGILPVLGELCTFAGGRVMTLLLQEGMFVVFFHWMGIDEYIVKVIAAVLVIISNYFISKLIVFRKKKQTDADTEGAD